jgi:hypothetical protein
VDLYVPVRVEGDRQVKARIIYDSDGTSIMVVTGKRISAQLWDSGKALIKVYDRKGKKVREIHLAKVYSIDKVMAGDLRTFVVDNSE